MGRMNIFKLVDATRRICELEKALEQSQSNLDAAKAELTAERTRIEAEAKVTTERLEAATTLAKESLAKIEALEAERKTVAQEAAALVARQGLAAPLADAKDGEPVAAKTKDQLWAEYRALKNDTERRAFYVANRASL